MAVTTGDPTAVQGRAQRSSAEPATSRSEAHAHAAECACQPLSQRNGPVGRVWLGERHGILSDVTVSTPVAAEKPIPSHAWVAAGLAAVVGLAGATFAAIAAMLGRSTSATLLRPAGIARNRFGMPLSDFEYWWARYGGWLFELVIALGIISALTLTWWSLRARRPRTCLLFAALTCVLGAIPILVNASRISV